MPTPAHAASAALRRRGILAALALALSIIAGSFLPMGAATAATTGSTAKPVFAYYYLWWSKNHWTDMLGPNYPTTASPLPLPAKFDAAGCNPTSLYSGNKLTDVPSKLYSQDDPGFMEADVRQAAAAGLSGFAVNWAGTGSASQATADIVYSRRLAALVAAVHKVNAEGITFKLWMSYKASATIRSTSAIQGDLAYFVRTYGKDSAFDRSIGNKPLVIWQGSRKYSESVLQAVTPQFRSSLRILGDENTWTSSRAKYLDGDAYYWSSQNPWSNPKSFSQLATLAATVRASGVNPDGTAKTWIAPAAPGYNAQLAGGSSCVPRQGGKTLQTLLTGNAKTNPDAIGLISWNEITEGSYIDPMTRYGNQELNVVKNYVATGS
jgi:Glycosyl hydrolase family 71